MEFNITLSNTRYGHLMTDEDSFLTKNNIFCVADGITRDPSSPLDFGDMAPEEILKNYPRPSGAKKAADLFCKEFIKNVDHGKTVKEAFLHGNQAIYKLNKKNIEKVDYLVNDFYACVASGGIIKNGKLYWGQICDCGIIVFNKKGTIKFTTTNGMQPFQEYINGREGRWGDPARRHLIRSQFRNNPNQIINGNLVSYGALTGEKRAEYFFKFGELKIGKGDLIVFYSDGFEHLVEKKDFFKVIYRPAEEKITQNFLDFDKEWSKNNQGLYGRERTLIATII
jgi:serine/threonine protein phosphatase PrpC